MYFHGVVYLINVASEKNQIQNIKLIYSYAMLVPFLSLYVLLRELVIFLLARKFVHLLHLGAIFLLHLKKVIHFFSLFINKF